MGERCPVKGHPPGRIATRPTNSACSIAGQPREQKEIRVKRVFNRSTVLLLVGVAAVAAITVTAASASGTKHAAGGDICVLMPDTATSIRWVHYDAPALKAEFKKAGVTSQFYNADGDAQKQTAQANQCLGNGAKVIIEVAEDAGSAAAI